MNTSGGSNGESGKSLAVAGTGEIVVGSPKQDVSTVVDSGAVQVFDEVGSALLLSIESPNAVAYDDYGSALEVTSINTIAVSARFKDNAAANDGSVYLHDAYSGNLL